MSNLDKMIIEALGEPVENKKHKRSQEYYRYERRRHINRKKGIIKRCSGGGDPWWVVKYDGELSKGKIHCSCPMCRFHGQSHSDMKKSDKMRYMEKEYAECV